MAISASNLLENSDTTDQAIYTTASATTGGANRLMLLQVVTGRTDGTAAAPTGVTGMGVTWVSVRTAETITSGNLVVSLWRALGTATNGALTITHAGTMHNCAWRLTEFAGVDTSGTNGSGAIVQTNAGHGTSSSQSVTLSSAITAGNATYGASGVNSTSETCAPATGYTRLGSTLTVASPSSRYDAEYRLDGQTSVGFAYSGTSQKAIIAVEIKAGAVTATGTLNVGFQLSATSSRQQSATATLNIGRGITNSDTRRHTLTASIGLNHHPVGTFNLRRQTATATLNLGRSLSLASVRRQVLEGLINAGLGMVGIPAGREHSSVETIGQAQGLVAVSERQHDLGDHPTGFGFQLVATWKYADRDLNIVSVTLGESGYSAELGEASRYSSEVT